MKRWQKSKRQLRSRKLKRRKISSDRTAWFKLDKRIRMMVEKEGFGRLERLRNAIALDAGLPMPPIHVVPEGWSTPGESGGVIFASVRPVSVRDHFQYGVIVPVSTLVIVDDDKLLRRLLCHEFAHCFWNIVQVIREVKNGEYKRIGIDNGASNQELVERQLIRDKEQLIDPALWFGEGDAKEFMPESNNQLSKYTLKYIKHWINAGLPTQELDMRLKFDGELGIPDEIIEHIKKIYQLKPGPKPTNRK